MAYGDPWPYLTPWVDRPRQVVEPYPWLPPKAPVDQKLPTCETHDTPMRWAAKHGATKGHWHCDTCHEARGK